MARPSRKTWRLVDRFCNMGKGLILNIASHNPSNTIKVPNGIIKLASMRNSNAEDKSKTYTTLATAIQKAKDSNRSECLVLCLADRSDV